MDFSNNDFVRDDELSTSSLGAYVDATELTWAPVHYKYDTAHAHVFQRNNYLDHVRHMPPKNQNYLAYNRVQYSRILLPNEITQASHCVVATIIPCSSEYPMNDKVRAHHYSTVHPLNVFQSYFLNEEHRQFLAFPFELRRQSLH